MNPLSALYGASVGLRNRLYDRGSLRTNRLQGPVISVGSISTGGAGKTPFVLMLGGLLKQRGLVFDVLSRGYGRRTKGVMLVDPAGSPQEFGDEPLLIARKLGVPVIVGEDRYAAGQFAERTFGAHTHLLDDGFQHRRLMRDFDIALVTERDSHDSLLPIGRLREPLSSLSRASAIVLMDDAAADRIPARKGQYVWRVSRGIAPQPGDACIAFCGIARPQDFFMELRRAGAVLAGAREYPDHHSYSAADAHSLLCLRRQAGATAFVTTEKDAINLGDYLHELHPVHVVPVRMQFELAMRTASETLDLDPSPDEVLYRVITRQNANRVRE